ncbi:MAG: hypothetical protein C4582_05680 [Desulfobacteraceae bacterium]|jgi:hypothetical protein|nr:MAG: hypothetical protein C4582_05680 [Desulfobacteraceae bacterium]
MPFTYDLLDPFSSIHPGSLISDYSDWILFTLLLFFFWAVVGIALRRQFEESRYLRVLGTSTALALAVGTYYSVYQGWLHLSLEGLGFFGAVLLFIVIFFIIFGLIRGFGMRTANALPLGFALFYVSLWAVIPNILYTIRETFPPVNGILLVLFVVSVFKVVTAFFRHLRSSPLDIARDLKKRDFAPRSSEDVEIDREEEQERGEMKLVKRKTMKLTGFEIKTVEEIGHYLEVMIGIIERKGGRMDAGEVAELTQALRQIGKREVLLTQGLELIKRHVNAYRRLHRKNLPELEKRFQNEKDPAKKKIIEEEMTYQKRMLQVLDFLEANESRILSFSQAFNKIIATAIQSLKGGSASEARDLLVRAHGGLREMKQVYEKQKNIEKYILTLDRRTIGDLKKEKDRR